MSVTLNPDWLDSAVFLNYEKTDNLDWENVAMHRYGVKILLVKPLQAHSYTISMDFLIYKFIITKCIRKVSMILKVAQVERRTVAPELSVHSGSQLTPPG